MQTMIDTCGTCLAEQNCNEACFSELGEDECGVCDGEGATYECGCTDIPEGDCDCDGNILDDCGVCGGNNENSRNPWVERCFVGPVQIGSFFTEDNDSPCRHAIKYP